MKNRNGKTRGIVTLAAAAAFAAGTAGLAFAADPDLIIFDWAGYEDTAFHEAYIEQHGTSPTFTFFGDEDEAFEKLRAGFAADLGHPCSQSVVKWREAGLLQPLDPSRIAGWNDILPGLMAMEDLAMTPDGTAWFMPWDWGNTALTYRTDRIEAADVQSLRAFADPKFQGRVSIGDNVDDAYALAALAIGMTDWNEMTEEQFAEASAFLREVHKNVRLYWLDGTELAQAMASGEVDLAWAWNEATITLQGDGVPVEMKRDTVEGLSTWVCGYVHLANAPGSTDKVYDFLSAVNRPEVAEYIITEWGYGHGNAAGLAAMDQDALAEAGYADLDAFLDKTLFQSPLPAELKQRMIAEFERIKAGY